MKLSAKARYGLRAMIDLAVNTHREHVSLLSISDRQGISMNYLEQIFSALRRGGLVRSVKGARGGYVLSRPPGEISVGNILRVLEGSLAVIDDGDDGRKDTAVRRCLKTLVWDGMNRRINDLCDSTTLQDMVDNYYRGDKDFLLFDI